MGVCPDGLTARGFRSVEAVFYVVSFEIVVASSWSGSRLLKSAGIPRQAEPRIRERELVSSATHIPRSLRE